MFVKKWFIIPLIIVLMIAGGAFYVYQSKLPKLEYLTQAVTHGDIKNTVIAGGQVYADELIEVGAQATGRVDKLHVSLGQRVKKGELIAEIDRSQQENALKDEQAHYQSLLAQHDIKKIQLAQMQDEFTKQKQGFKAGVVAKNDYIKAQTALNVAQKELTASTLQLEQARLKIATAKTNLGYTRITAPIDGVVVAVVTKAGQNINAMQSSPTIIKLAQIDTVQIKAKFSEADIPKLKTGMKATFEILGLPKQQFDATLDSLELTPVSESSGSNTAVYYYGLLNVPNPNHQFFIGMSANVTVLIDQKQNTLIVPMTALGKQVGDDEFEVQVMENEHAKNPTISTRTVKVGLNDKINSEILSGLQEGEKVIISTSDGEVESVDTGW